MCNLEAHFHSYCSNAVTDASLTGHTLEYPALFIKNCVALRSSAHNTTQPPSTSAYTTINTQPLSIARMKEEPHIGDEHRQRSLPQKRRREDSESQPPASANRPGFHTFNVPRQAFSIPQQAFNVPQQVVPQNQAMVAAQDGDLMNDDPASSQDLMDTLQAEHIVLSRNNHRLKNQIQQHLTAADAQAERIGFLETQSETLNLKLMRAERENKTAQANFDAIAKKRVQSTNNVIQKMARDNQAKVSGLQTALQASNGQRQRDLTALQYKHERTVADHQARIAELQDTIRRQELLLQQTRNLEAQRQFAEAQRQFAQRQVQVSQCQQAQCWEIRRQLLEEVERQDGDMYPEAEAQNQEAQRQEDTSQEDAPQEAT